MTDVDLPYDWERYGDDWRPSPEYTAQEAVIRQILQDLALSTRFMPNILEVGPGLGRITAILLEIWPNATYSFIDVAANPLQTAVQMVERYTSVPGGRPSAQLPTMTYQGDLASVELAHEILDIQPNGFELVVAVEVMLHITPEQVGHAAINLVGLTHEGGHLITCDWTEELPPRRDGSLPPVRVQNYRHDYPSIFHRAGASLIESTRTGLQSVYRVQP